MNGQVVFLKKVIRKYLVDMLIKTLLMPCALSEFPKNPSYSDLFCNNAIGLLHDLCENCILLVDRDNQIKKNLLKVLQKSIMLINWFILENLIVLEWLIKEKIN